MTPSRRAAPAVALLLLLPGFAGAAPAEEAAPAAHSWRIERQGIVVEASVEPLDSAGPRELREGDDARFRFTIRDTATGAPFSGVYPAAWMNRLETGERPDPRSCVEKIEEFLGGSILNQPELDLNAYYVLALNDDASISVVDPLFGFGGSKLLAMIALPEPGEDWALSPDRQRLFVSLPGSGQVAVVDTSAWKVTGLLAVDGRPGRLAMQPDGAYLWLAVDGGPGAGEAGESAFSGVAVVDAREPRLVSRIATGAGPHAIALAADSRFAFVTNSGAGTVSVVDVAALAEVAEVATGRGPAAVAYSALASAAYVTHREEGTIVALDGRRHEVVARMKAFPGLGEIAVAPGGRFAFAVNPESDQVYVVDTAVNRIVQSGKVEGGPDQVAFSDELAYVRHRNSEIVLMVPLDEVGKQEGEPLPVVDTPGGEQPFGRGARPSPALSIVQAPGANAMLFANPADEAIYFYKEGMAAPMGHFRNYGRQPRAVLVVDRSLRQRTAPGVYETTAKLRRPGRYQLAFFLDAPRIVHCFDAEVTPNPQLEAEHRANRPVVVEPLIADRRVTVGEPVTLRFRVADPTTGAPLSDLADITVQVYQTGGHWQNRQRAESVGEGLYRVSVVLPEPGAYAVAVATPSGRLAFHQSPQVILRAEAGSGAAAAGGGLTGD